MRSWVRLFLATVAVLAFGIVFAGKSFAAGDAVPTFALVIKDHKFDKETLEVPANQKIVLTVHNADATPEEFESHDLHREKIIPGGGTVTVNLGPLKPGTYKFFGEFNEKTAKGVIVVK